MPQGLGALGAAAATASPKGSRSTRRQGRLARRTRQQQSSGGLALTLAGAAAGLMATLLRRALRGGRQRHQLTAAAEAPLACLPAELLVIILQQLGLQDGLCLLATYRRLRLLSAELTPQLWQDVQVRLTSVHHVQHFTELLVPPAPHVQRLSVSAPFLAGDPAVLDNGWAAMRQAAAERDAAGALAVVVARAPSLTALSWAMCGRHKEELRLWAQPGVLPLLRSLTLICHFILEVPRELRDGLPALWELHIVEDVFQPIDEDIYEHRSGIRLATGCLPAGLQQLEIVAAGELDLPPATLAACVQLTELSMSNRSCRLPFRPSQSTQILQLHSLQRLRLGDSVPSSEILGALAQLPELTALDCSLEEVTLIKDVTLGRSSEEEGSAHADTIAALRALAASPPARLRELNLGGLQMLWLPQEVLTIPSLEVLHLELNPFICLAGGQAELENCPLRHVTLEVTAAQHNLEVLRRMPQLSQLHVRRCRMWTEDGDYCLNAVLPVRAALQGAVAVTCGPGPTVLRVKRVVDILQQSDPYARGPEVDILQEGSIPYPWGPEVKALRVKLAEERVRAVQAQAREGAAAVGKVAAGAAAGALAGAAVHLLQRLC